MKKLLLLLALLANPSLAWANELNVTIIVSAGSTPISYKLSEANSRLFWNKWNQLALSEGMVPLPDGSSYGGLLIRDQERNKEVRIYNTVTRMDEKTRKDEFRMLERWVLSFAPPPLGPSLLAALDKEIGNSTYKEAAAAAKPMTAQQIILSCRARGKGNERLRALCLEEHLKANINMKDYADALERIAGPQGPPGLER